MVWELYVTDGESCMWQLSMFYPSGIKRPDTYINLFPCLSFQESWKFATRMGASWRSEGVELGEGMEPGMELQVELGVEPHEEVGAWLKRVQWIATRMPAHHQPPLAAPPHLPQGPSPSLRLLVAFLLRRRTC